MRRGFPDPLREDPPPAILANFALRFSTLEFPGIVEALAGSYLSGGHCAQD